MIYSRDGNWLPIAKHTFLPQADALNRQTVIPLSAWEIRNPTARCQHSWAMKNDPWFWNKNKVVFCPRGVNPNGLLAWMMIWTMVYSSHEINSGRFVTVLFCFNKPFSRRKKNNSPRNLLTPKTSQVVRTISNWLRARFKFISLLGTVTGVEPWSTIQLSIVWAPFWKPYQNLWHMDAGSVLSSDRQYATHRKRSGWMIPLITF